MRGLLPILVILLCGCNPYVDARRGIAHAGFMNKNQAFAGKLKTPDGATASWSVIGSDATDVPIAIKDGLLGYGLGKITGNVQMNKDDNSTKEVLGQQRSSVEIERIKATPVPPTIVPEGTKAVFAK